MLKLSIECHPAHHSNSKEFICNQRYLVVEGYWDDKSVYIQLDGAAFTRDNEDLIDSVIEHINMNLIE